jgi:hypothetical protein
MNVMMACFAHQHARSIAAQSQNAQFPNNPRTRPRSNVPPGAPSQQRPPLTGPTAAGVGFRPINTAQLPASGRNC